MILFGFVVTLAGVPLPTFHSDSALYGHIAKNILSSGEWLTLRHETGWMVDKPPLTIWLIALSFRLGGATDAALRLWHVLMGLALVVVTYLIARVGAKKEQALLAALILVSTFQVFYLTLAPQQDVPLALFLALAFYAYLNYRRTGRTLAAALMGLWVALAVLTKGMLSLAAFTVIVAADMLISSRRSERDGFWRWTQIGIGAVVCILVAAPWFVVGAIRQGMPFVDTFFLTGSLGIGRFFTPKQAPIPYWLALVAYVPMLAFWMLPWTGLLPGAISSARQALREGDPALRLCALWAGLYFLALSLSPGDKVYRHLHPVFPPLAALGARALQARFADRRALRWAAAITSLVGLPIIIAGGLFLAGQGPGGSTVYRPIAVPFLIALALALAAFTVAALQGAGRTAVAVLAAATLMAYALLEWKIMQNWETIWPWRRVAAEVHRLYRPGDRVILVGTVNGEAQFALYHLELPVIVWSDEAQFVGAWPHGGVFGLLPDASFARLKDRLNPRILVQMPAGWVLVTNR